MFKKIIISFILLFFGISISFASIADCGFDPEKTVDLNYDIDKCLKNSDLIDGNNLELDGSGGGFSMQVDQWVNTLGLFLGTFAVGSIIFGALMLTISAGEEEKIKKAKDIIKWGMIGFVLLIAASSIILLIVRIMYSL